MPSKNKLTNLLVVAHPDDETLFFAGLLQSKPNWHVVCVTDGNADDLGAARQDQFLRACKALKVKRAEILKLPDVFDQRLDIEDLASRLRNLGFYKNVFTHSILGEYGHRHHQDVSFATHKAFAFDTNVYSIAYNAYPDLKINLTPKQHQKKTEILWDIYSSETKRLINYLPAHAQEGFTKLSYKEAESIYLCLTESKPLDKKIVKVYRWLIPYLEAGGALLSTRPF